MSLQGYTEAESTALGAAAAFVEAVILQPTIYWKNAAQQGLPFTVNPRIVYRGMGAALANEMGQMGLQFGATATLQKAIAGGENRPLRPMEEVASALLGGVMVAPFASFCELTMIQQQRFGGTLVGTPLRIARQYGPVALMRGFWPCVIRDGIYTGCLLGVTPSLQNYLERERGWHSLPAGAYASLIAGTFAGILTTPADGMSTSMKGDLDRKIYGGFLDTVRTRSQGGLKTFCGGMFWRTVNISGTIYIANEARIRLAPIMFPGKGPPPPQ